MAALTVSDVKQWLYCPRVVYWTRVAGLERPYTSKMSYGKEAHDALDLLERRRTFRQYGLESARRHFHLRIHSDEMDLAGMLDLCLETPDALYPVEFKDTLRGLQQNHKLQMAAYALLLEEQFGRPAEKAFWVSIPRNEVRVVPLPRALKEEVRGRLEEIRSCIRTELLPAPADRWAKCRDCEFLRFCGDRYA